MRSLQFAVRLLLPASPAVKSALIFNTPQSDSYTSMVHIMSTAHYILFKALSMINNCLCDCMEEYKNHCFAIPGEMRDVQGWQCVLWIMLPQSHTLLFSLILSAPSLSMTAFAALKWTLFYDRLELWFD